MGLTMEFHYSIEFLLRHSFEQAFRFSCCILALFPTSQLRMARGNISLSQFMHYMPFQRLSAISETQKVRSQRHLGQNWHNGSDSRAKQVGTL
jgi:hypothetical protein